MNEERDAEKARRAYWAEQMEAASGFMAHIFQYPVAECGETLVSLESAAEEAGIEIEFSRSKIAGKFKRLFLLREGLTKGFVAIARAVNKRGWILKVEDAFRTRQMQKELATADYVLDFILRKTIWELNGKLPTPDFLFRRMTALIATSPKIGTHMSGSALDISVLRSDDRSELDRGGPYIELSELTPMDSPFISAEAAAHRREITALLREHGFIAYPYEFWHYSKGDAYDEYMTKSGRAARYGAVDYDPVSKTVAPIANPEKPLHSLGDIERQLRIALSRRSERKGRE